MAEVAGGGSLASLDGSRLQDMVPPTWRAAIHQVAGDLDFDRLALGLRREHRRIVPSHDLWFRALEATPLEKVKAVILGQDPYADARYADGLAFSVPAEGRLPLSLRRILVEARRVAAVDEGARSLLPWAKCGVLLLNTALTVPEHVPGGHLHLGWQPITDAVLQAVVRQPRAVVFFVWGSRAQTTMRRNRIEEHQKAIVLPNVHPAERRGRFVGSDPFGSANARLGDEKLDWSLGPI